jgi:phage-related protein
LQLLSAQGRLLDALTVVAEGGMPLIAKPLKGFGPGVLELALAFRGDAFRVVYAVQLGAEVWVIHAFQKKSKRGVATSKREIDLITARLRRLNRSFYLSIGQPTENTAILAIWLFRVLDTKRICIAILVVCLMVLWAQIEGTFRVLD